MLSNLVIFGLPVLLAGSLFLLPSCYRSASRLRCAMINLTLHAGVFVFLAVFHDLRSAVAVAILSALLVALGKILVINFRMVHTAHYPKHRRCY